MFKLTVISNTGEILDELDVSAEIGTDNKSKPIIGQSEPMITCSFIADDNLFISAYHRIQRTQYHFTYNFQTKTRLSDVYETHLHDCSSRNFPIKSFYSLVTKRCHTFFRQGQGFSCIAEDPSNHWDEVLTDQDMGVMYMLFDEALVTRSSGSILFFKLKHDVHEVDHRGTWSLYHTIEDMRGSVYFIRGNVRIQIVTDEKIYFYLIDKKTLMPHLENVMFNFMHCSQMMFGSRVRYGISYKTGQPNFTIYTRKYFHNFKVQINS